MTMSKILFAMYNQETDCVEVTLDNHFHITFNYQNCNALVRLTNPLDISYLIRFAREEPGFYASLLQGKVNCTDMWKLWESLFRNSPILYIQLNLISFSLQSLKSPISVSKSEPSSMLFSFKKL